MKAFNALLLLTVLLSPTMSLALSPAPPPEGPYVPCVGCDSLTAAPYPETGLWSNPEQSPGSGLNFEIQNGMLAGYLYTYSGTGEPEWYILSGPLVRSETTGVMWELDTNLMRVEGGSCIDCNFVAPDQITSGERILLEFRQRNYLAVRIFTEGIGALFNQRFVPFTYGSVGKAYFLEQTPYLMPELGQVRYQEPFVLSIRPVNDAEANEWVAYHVYIRGPELSGTPESRILTYNIWNLQPNGPQTGTEVPPAFGRIICELDANLELPGCRVELGGATYRMPIGNFSDSRFFAEATDGSVIEAYRIIYD